MGADGFQERTKGSAYFGAGLAEPWPDAVRADEAANGFPDQFPDCSSRTSLTDEQKASARQFLAVLGIGGLLDPVLTLSAIGMVGLCVFTLILAYRLILSLIGKSDVYLLTRPVSLHVLLPVYTVLIALKDEAESVPQLAASLAAFDYPKHLLDVKLLIETGDDATREAIRAETWPDGTELLVLPEGMPRTKPRALNYGLSRARGAFVTVYDAEDRPNPGQLRAAALRFAWDPDLTCLQAPLVGDAKHGNWLSRQWALEYAIQFQRVMPALSRLGMPIALGGTSNHFRRSALVAAGGWDAWNVTEDADLGLRFARQGKRVGVISPPTVEVPPAKLGVWIGQRSRWLKGFLQTWLVLMRDPAALIRDMGMPGFLSMQLTLGASILSALSHLPWLVWCLYCLVSPERDLGEISWTVLIASYLGGAISVLTVPRSVFDLRLVDVLTLPFYWPLQSFAMLRAVYSLVRTPHYWAKTPHVQVFDPASQLGVSPVWE